MNRERKIVLEVKGLNKSFGKKKILNNINFQLKSGEVLAIIGPSGAGKTTLLRCINDLERCDSGIIKLDDTYYNNKSTRNSKELKYARRKIGLVFQNYNLFPHMTIMENIIEAPISVLKLSKEEAIARGLKLLKIMGLEDKKDSYPFELSGGQKQRVAIARACALNPKIMCLDEPTSALDPELREEIACIIEGLANENMSILNITHDMAFAKRIANRIIFMEDGKVLKEANNEDFFNDLEDDRIRRFIAI